MMLVTGLSSSVFWPTTSFLSDVVGWRGTCLVYCGMLLLSVPAALLFGLPRRTEPKDEAIFAAQPAGKSPIVKKSTFLPDPGGDSRSMRFVAFGFSAVLIELLKAEGLSATRP